MNKEYCWLYDSKFESSTGRRNMYIEANSRMRNKLVCVQESETKSSVLQESLTTSHNDNFCVKPTWTTNYRLLVIETFIKCAFGCIFLCFWLNNNNNEKSRSSVHLLLINNDVGSITQTLIFTHRTFLKLSKDRF